MPITAGGDPRRLPARCLLIHGEAGYAVVKESSLAGCAFTMVRVLPEERRRGVGSALLAACSDEARELGKGSLYGRVEGDDPESFRLGGAARLRRDLAGGRADPRARRRAARPSRRQGSRSPSSAPSTSKASTPSRSRRHRTWPSRRRSRRRRTTRWLAEMQGPDHRRRARGRAGRRASRRWCRSAAQSRHARARADGRPAQPPPARDRRGAQARADPLGRRPRLQAADHLDAGGQRRDAEPEPEARLPRAARRALAQGPAPAVSVRGDGHGGPEPESWCRLSRVLTATMPRARISRSGLFSFTGRNTWLQPHRARLRRRERSRARTARPRALPTGGRC